METDSSDSPAAAAAGCPRWVMVNRHSYCMPAADSDAKTTSAASHTSAGQLFRVSFRLTRGAAGVLQLLPRLGGQRRRRVRPGSPDRRTQPTATASSWRHGFKSPAKAFNGKVTVTAFSGL